MNKIVIHGKVTVPAKLVLAEINNEQTAVTKFTMVDIGEHYHPCDPTFFKVNCATPAAAKIVSYLTRDKEVLVTGKMQEKFRNTGEGDKKEVYFVIADTVTLLPVFEQIKSRDKEDGMQ